MRITDLNYTKQGNRVRTSAKVTWEDSERESQEIYFETDREFSLSIHPNPHAFVIASILPALYFGESRLHIDEEVCPKLKEGLVTALSLLHHWWYPPNHKLVSIEAKKLKKVSLAEQPKRAAFCFSGGIDSMSTLFINRTEYPKSHPGYLKDGLIVFGLEVREMEKFQDVLGLIATIAEGSDLTFVPVYTNIIQLGPKDLNEYWGKFWLNEYMSASFSSIAHSFSKRWGNFSINSSHDIPNLIPHGSNPLLTACYSSWDLQIKEEGISYSRFKKTQLISNWNIALQNLRVCNETKLYRSGAMNCGKCEKCVRTMLALVASSALEKTTAFPVDNVTPELVHEAVHLKENIFPLYKELMAPLANVGRHDLVHSIERKIVKFHHDQKKEKWREKMIQPIAEFDRIHLKGILNKIKKIALS